MTITKYDRFQQLLIEVGDAKLSIHDITQILQITNRHALSRAMELFTQNKISRIKEMSTSMQREVYKYYMTDEQKAAFEQKMGKKLAKLRKERKEAPLPAKAPKPPAKPASPAGINMKKPKALVKPDGVLALLGLDAANCQQRLKFCYFLRDKTIFAERELLHEIIADYEYTLKKLHR